MVHSFKTLVVGIISETIFVRKKTELQNTNKFSIWNEETGRSAQEKLSISTLFVGTYGEFTNILY